MWKQGSKIYVLTVLLLALFLFAGCPGEEKDRGLIQSLKIITDKLPEAKYGEEYYIALSAADGVPPYRWEIKGNLPKGLQFDRILGVIKGRPEADAESSMFEVRLYDSLKSEKPVPVVGRYNLRVYSGPVIASEDDLLPLKILTNTLPKGESGEQYEVAFSATGGLPPYNWNIKGELPGNLVFDEQNGILKGIAREEGSWPLEITVRDMLGRDSDNKIRLTLTVLPKALIRGKELERFEVLTRNLPIGVVDEQYWASLSTTGGVPRYSWTLGSRLPDGLNFLNETASIEGIPIKPGNYQLNFSVVDSSQVKNSRSVNYNLTILPEAINRLYPLVLISDSLAPAYKGENYRFSLSAQGGLLPYKWTTLNPLPEGIQIDKAKGIIYGIPKAEGNYTVKLELVDSSIPPKAAWKDLKLEILEREEASFLGSIIPYLLVIAALGFGIYTYIKFYKPVTTREKPEVLSLELPNAYATVPYFAVLTARGGVPPYKWDSTGLLPDGLKLDQQAGVLSGTPEIDSVGSYKIDVSLKDNDSPPARAYGEVILAISRAKMETKKEVFTTVAYDARLFFEKFPPGSGDRQLIGKEDLQNQEGEYIRLLKNLKGVNDSGDSFWVIYCRTELPSGLEVAHEARRIAESMGINFYVMLK